MIRDRLKENMRDINFLDKFAEGFLAKYIVLTGKGGKCLTSRK